MPRGALPVILPSRSPSSVRRIAIVSSSRADFAHLRWLLHDLAAHPAVDLRVIALGPHLSPEFGRTASHLTSIPGLAADAITQVECLLDSDTDVGMAKTLGVATLGLAEVLAAMRPDLLVIVADRYEMLAPASVALTLRIPVAHIEGGEISEGAIDDAVRNALTKLSHLHFACTRQAERRIVALGEEPWRVHWSGSLSLDDLRRQRLPTRAQIESRLGWKRSDALTPIVAIYHPVTIMRDTTAEAVEFFAAMEQLLKQQILKQKMVTRKGAIKTFANQMVAQPVVFVYPNADAGSRRIIARIEALVTKYPSAKRVVNLSHLDFLSLLHQAALLVGNSSAGMIESTSLNLPTLNIGIRQQGREHAGNVIDVPARRKRILTALERAMTADFRRSIQGLDSPYGDGHASERVVKVLTEVELGEKLLRKRPVEIEAGGSA